MSNLLVIDIGGSSIKTADFTKEGKLLSKSSYPVPGTYQEMKSGIISLYNRRDYFGISISSPGAINPKTGQGYGMTAIEYIPSGGNLKQDLEEILGTPVAIENDANCAGLSEIHFTAGVDSIAYIVLGSGVGGCMITDGKIVTGSNYFGGEFGCIPYKDATYSDYAGMRGLSRQATGNPTITTPGLEIFAKSDSGEEPYKNAVDEYYKALAHLITVLKCTLDPQEIIFAGAVTNRPQFLDEVKAKINESAAMKVVNDLSSVNIKIGQFGSDANVYGAYANFVRRYNV